MAVADRIRTLRRQAGLTQTELGEKLGVKKNAVSKWECGRVEDIPSSKIKAMADLFGVKPSYFIDDFPADASPIPSSFEWPTMPEKVSSFAQRLREGMNLRGITQAELSAKSGVSKSSITRYLQSAYEGKQGAVYALAHALDVTEAWLMGYDVPSTPASSAPIPPGFEPLPEMVQVPLIGSIACGSPILAEGNIESYVGIPAAWRADFALTCHGDSMAPKICDGDIVCIRKQAMVEPGEIAAVRIGEEATLKHFYQSGEVVQLVAENAAVCPPMVYQGEQLREICIEGKAVGFCRGLGK